MAGAKSLTHLWPQKAAQSQKTLEHLVGASLLKRPSLSERHKGDQSLCLCHDHAPRAPAEAHPLAVWEPGQESRPILLCLAPSPQYLYRSETPNSAFQR